MKKELKALISKIEAEQKSAQRLIKFHVKLEEYSTAFYYKARLDVREFILDDLKKILKTEK